MGIAIAIANAIGYQGGAGSEAGIFEDLIHDLFTTDRSAGAINGTNAEPGPGVRTVDDTGSRLTIASAKLTAASGGSNGDPKVYYAAVTRSPGRILIGEMYAIGAGGFARCQIGVLNEAGGSVISSLGLGGSGAIRANLTGLSPITIGAYAVDTSYPAAMIVRSVGYAFFVKMSGHWLLLWLGGAAANDVLYPTMAAFSSGEWSSDFFRVPALRWLPTPLVSDGFSGAASDGLGHTEGVAGGLGSGGDGVTWTGKDWGVSSGVASNTPELSSDLSANGDMEEWNSTTDLFAWTEQIAGTSTVNQESTEVHGGTYAARLTVDGSNSLAKIYQTFANSSGDWFLVRLWAKTDVAGRSIAVDENNGSNAGTALVLSTTYTEYVTLIRATKANTDIGVKRSTGTSANLYIDDITIQTITLTSMMRSVSLSEDDLLLSVEVTRVSGSLAGLVVALDSTSTPANCIFVFLDGSGYVRVAKVVAGVYTPLASTAVTYSAGAELRVTKNATKVRVYYNNAFVGSELTISDAGIVSNTIHGLFSSDASNEFDNFVAYALGADGEYDSTLDALLPPPKLVGATWARDANDRPYNSPSVGSELVTNGDFEAFTSGLANNWLKVSTPTTTQETTIVHGGTSSQKVLTTANAQGVRQYFSSTANKWLRGKIWGYQASGTTVLVRAIASASTERSVTIAGASWQKINLAWRSQATNNGFYISQLGSGSAEFYLDDASIKELTQNELYAYIQGVAGQSVKCAIYFIEEGIPGGVISHLDDPATPANGVWGIHDGTKAYLLKLVGGVYTSLIAVVAPFVEDAYIEVRRPSGNTFQLWYNGSQIGTDQTISDAGVINNTYYGAFSTLPDNLFTPSSFTLDSTQYDFPE